MPTDATEPRDLTDDRDAAAWLEQYSADIMRDAAALAARLPGGRAPRGSRRPNIADDYSAGYRDGARATLTAAATDINRRADAHRAAAERAEHDADYAERMHSLADECRALAARLYRLAETGR